jgi:hypothetical protein
MSALVLDTCIKQNMLGAGSNVATVLMIWPTLIITRPQKSL